MRSSIVRRASKARRSLMSTRERSASGSSYRDRVGLRLSPTPTTSQRHVQTSTSAVRLDHAQSRGIHSSAAQGKPGPGAQHRLQALQVTIPDRDFGDEGFASSADIARLLAEWRARDAPSGLEADISNRQDKGKSPLRELNAADESVYLAPSTQDPSTLKVDGALSSDFFSSRYHDRRAADEKDIADTTIIHAETSVRKERNHHRARRRLAESMWIPSIDQDMCASTFSETVSQIISGTRDVRQLAKDALHSLCGDTNSTPRKEQECRLHEVELAILNYWVISAKDGVDKLASQPRFASFFVSISNSLYESMTASKKVSAISTPALEYLTRVVLHRMFSVSYEISKHADVDANTQILAMSQCASLLRDSHLKPSQARYLTRKLLSRISDTLRFAPSRHYHSQSGMWAEIHSSLEHLLLVRVIVPLHQPPQAVTSKNDFVFHHIEEFMRLASLSASKSKPLRRQLATLIVRMARRSLDVSIGSASRKDEEHMPKENATPFIVSTRRLEEVIDNLIKARAYEAAYELVNLAPKSQRTFRCLALLSQKWSNTPLVVEGVPCIQGRASASKRSTQMHDHRSKELLEATMAWLERTHSRYERRLIQLCEARSFGHARSADPALLIRDIDTLRLAFRRQSAGDEVAEPVDRITVLRMLSKRAQLNAVRAFVASGRWRDGVALAKKLLSGNGKSVHKSGTDGFGSRMINVLLVSSVQLRRQMVNLSPGGLVRRSVSKRQKVAPDVRRHLTSRPSRLRQLRRQLAFLERFCEATGTIPNEHARTLILSGLFRCRSSSVHRSVRVRAMYDIDWRWRERGVSTVLADVRASLRRDSPEADSSLRDNASIAPAPYSAIRAKIPSSRINALVQGSLSSPFPPSAQQGSGAKQRRSSTRLGPVAIATRSR